MGSRNSDTISLSTLAPARGARKLRKRVGRGEGSGMGKTSGKGGKGQTARSGASIPAWFEGGQMPLYRRLPNVGFRSLQQISGQNRFVTVPLSALEKFDAGATVGPEELKQIGFKLGGNTRRGFKILSTGSLSKKLSISCHSVSKAAKARIEELGGTVTIL